MEMISYLLIASVISDDDTTGWICYLARVRAVGRRILLGTLNFDLIIDHPLECRACIAAIAAVIVVCGAINDLLDAQLGDGLLGLDCHHRLDGGHRGVRPARAALALIVNRRDGFTVAPIDSTRKVLGQFRQQLIRVNHFAALLALAEIYSGVVVITKAIAKTISYVLCQARELAAAA